MQFPDGRKTRVPPSPPTRIHRDEKKEANKKKCRKKVTEKEE